jgi:translation initiation factor IF-2
MVFEVIITADTKGDAEDMEAALIDAAINISNSYNGEVLVMEAHESHEIEVEDDE